MNKYQKRLLVLIELVKKEKDFNMTQTKKCVVAIAYRRVGKKPIYEASRERKLSWFSKYYNLRLDAVTYIYDSSKASKEQIVFALTCFARNAN